ncbi:hypothetical protein MTR67_035399 [Solanum verrucosum]|uniref:Uncharacterized protein n=1 Tax=Solanum verrucosum TaxID=315347 RepID=A0AAF0UAG9_SOLVR|nr:hypothetical protein MTR67_035399 [Solanum verrucosum]
MFYIQEIIQQTLSQSTVDESIVSPDDAIGKVLGKEHSGRHYKEMVNNHNQMMVAFKSYMIIKEGTLLE